MRCVTPFKGEVLNLEWAEAAAVYVNLLCSAARTRAKRGGGGKIGVPGAGGGQAVAIVPASSVTLVGFTS